jgi:hypothetical protein
MTKNLALRVTSLFALLLLTFHLTHDTIREAEGSMLYPIPVIVFTGWLYGILALSDRVAGYVIMFLGGLFSAAMIVMHSPGFVVHNSGGFFFTWTLFALAATGWVTMVLSARGIWMAYRGRGAGAGR